MRSYLPILLICVTIIIFPRMVRSSEMNVHQDDYLPIKHIQSADVSKYMIHFDLSAVPRNAIIDHAYVEFTADADTSLHKPIGVAAYLVTGAWEGSANATVTNRLNYTDSLRTFGPMPTRIACRICMPCTDIVKSWVIGSTTNYGFLVMPYGYPDSKLNIYTDEMGVVARLRVLYTVPAEDN